MSATATRSKNAAAELLPWERYSVTVTVDRLVAGIPANPKLMQAWLEANEAPAEAGSDQTAMIERLDPEETHAVVFYRDEAGRPSYESRNFKAALKEAANILKGPGLLDVKNFRSKLAERVFVGPRTVTLDVPIGKAERPISVMTMQGPRTSIKRFEYADNVTLSFILRVLKDGVVKESHLLAMLEYLEEGGIGADRSQGSGTFHLVEFKAVR